MASAEYQNNLQNSALRRTTQILRDCLAELEASQASTAGDALAKNNSPTPTTVRTAQLTSRASSDFR